MLSGNEFLSNVVRNMRLDRYEELMQMERHSLSICLEVIGVWSVLKPIDGCLKVSPPVLKFPYGATVGIPPESGSEGGSGCNRQTGEIMSCAFSPC
jgi:hypothetical protein